VSEALTSRQRKHLRGLAHALEPVVHVGQAGVTDAVLAELERALAAHELIKVRLHQPEDKKALAAAVEGRTGATSCGLVGHVVILYRRHPETPRIALPI
jgi:RNA-binding protein